MDNLLLVMNYPSRDTTGKAKSFLLIFFFSWPHFAIFQRVKYIILLASEETSYNFLPLTLDSGPACLV